jgi:PPM family protein phosphatase
MLDVRSGSASEAGQVRSSNEDSVFAGSRVFVVADGMGGHAAGEVASGLTVARLAGLDGREELKPEDIRKELYLSNQDILDAARRNPEQHGMGTTVAGLALAFFAGSLHWVVFNAGDCRVYRFAQGVLVQLTVDHTEVGELVTAGVLDAADALTHPGRHVVTRALGSDPAPEPDVWMLPPTAGESFLLCSDGLFGELADAEIAEVMRGEAVPGRAAEALVDLAVKHGGRDNVSVIVVTYTQEPDLAADAVDEQTIPRRAREEAS